MITRKPRGARIDDPIDDLLGFGKPKKNSPAPEPVKKEEEYVSKKKDNFLE